MKWSKLRSRVEGLLADSVNGRVKMHSTRHRGMQDQDGRDWITLDGQELVNMPIGIKCRVFTNTRLARRARPRKRLREYGALLNTELLVRRCSTTY